MPPIGRRGVDLYGQSAATGAWVWAGNQVGADFDDDQVCGPVAGITKPLYDSFPTPGAMDPGAVSRSILYLPLWRACSGL